ncbi:phosphomethylpyrimidine kinase domain-containing protein [Ditylenchus destructor]|nr:phosphomethylpyrimidine kinase domain-containing protein [Ditylenchus destructor]
MIQIRAPEWHKKAILTLAKDLLPMTRDHGVPLLIDDHVDVAIASGVDGVHVGQKDLPAIIARELMGENKIVGLSVSNHNDLEKANKLGTAIDYLGVGPVFATTTKTDTAPMSSTRIPNVLTIAGSDSGGGAGIQADLKVFTSLGVYGTSAITLLTAQNTLGIRAVHTPDASFLTQQLEAVFEDIEIHAYKPPNVILDPITVSTSGHALLSEDAIEALKIELIPLCTLITPNLQEAAILANVAKAPSTEEEMKDCTKVLLHLGPQAVLIKGGHLVADDCPDFLLVKGETEPHKLSGIRLKSKNTHGSGCTLSAAVAAFLARGLELKEAVAGAKLYTTEAIANNSSLNVGKGVGPLNHVYKAVGF